MGLNVVIACHRHRVQTYMMRGEEPLDLQWWMRNHGDCFAEREIAIYRDCDYYPKYPQAYEYEQRPKVVGFR